MSRAADPRSTSGGGGGGGGQGNDRGGDTLPELCSMVINFSE